MSKDAEYWINQLQLSPHPEGGYYAESYKSKKDSQDQVHCSLIYFLLKEHDISAFHRLKSDEVWLFHAGASLTLYMIDTQGNMTSQKCGLNPDKGEALQLVIPANTWFAAELNRKLPYALCSCMVSPGFTWDDFELAQREHLMQMYPDHATLIERLCK